MSALDYLAPAIGIAASPFGVVPAILLLFTPTPRANAGAFLLGWAGGVLAGFLLMAWASDLAGARESGPLFAPLRLIAGGALIVLAARQWRNRSKAEVPGWMTNLAQSTPAASLRLGLLLSLANPKVLLLSAAGGLSVAGQPDIYRAAVLFSAVASALVAAPLLVHLAAGEKAMAPLGRVRTWLIRHNGAIVGIVLAIIGAKLMTAGLEALV